MSALQDPDTFGFTTFVAAQRGLSDDEVYDFLANGVIPDLSQPPKTASLRPTDVVMSESDARTLLSGRPVSA